MVDLVVDDEDGQIILILANFRAFHIVITKSQIKMNPMQEQSNADIVASDVASQDNGLNENISLLVNSSSTLSSVTSSFINFWSSENSLPFKSICKALLLAWIYTIIPVYDFWLYTWFKKEFWVAMICISKIEMANNVLPDSPDSIYILAYFGVFVAPISNTILWFLNMEDSYIMANVIQTLPTVWMVSVFAIDCLTTPKSRQQLQALEKLKRDPSFGMSRTTHSNSSNLSSYHQDWGATFAAMGLDDSTIGGRAVSTVGISLNLMEAPNEPESGHSYDINCSHANSSLFSLTLSSSADPGNESISPSMGEPSSKYFHKITINKPFQDLLSIVQSCLHEKYFFFLPRFQQKVYMAQFGGIAPQANRREIWVVLSIYLFLYTGNYISLIFFTMYFRTIQANFSHRFALCLIYILFMSGFRIALKTTGMYLDRYKNKSCSMFFVGEFLGLMFYYIFYRVLFESIHSIPEFLALQALHLVSEWILYVLRATEWYYQTTEYFGEKYFSWALMKPRLSHAYWQQFIALDFGIRCTVFVTTAFGFLLLLTTVQFVPYLGDSNGLHVTLLNYEKTAGFIIFAVVLEFINAFIMHQVYFKKVNLRVRQKLLHCFSLKEFAFMVVTISTVMFINPVFAFTIVHFHH